MKHMRTTVIVLLNILFCIILLWLFTRNAFLRPYAGSPAKEIIAASLLLLTLYANYFLLYPLLYKNHPVLYWLSVITASLIAAGVDMAIAYPNIAKCSAFIIAEIGLFRFFSRHVLFIFGRNLAFNFFPFMIRERKEMQEALATETKIVYQNVQMIDAMERDKPHRMHLLPIKDIYYCMQDANYTRFYVIQEDYWYMRYGSMRYLEQLFDSKEFIRISSNILVPFRYIESCDEVNVVMKKMSWTKEPLTFQVNLNRKKQIADVINDFIQAEKSAEVESGNVEGDVVEVEIQEKRNISMPPQKKLDAVLSYIRKNPGCRSTIIVSHTKYSLSTVERCLTELRKQGLIKYEGSKKFGGYKAVDSRDVARRVSTT